MEYSIAIRTLGTAGEKFYRELESLKRQTIQPRRIIVYVAETCGVKYVDGSVGKEEYRYVPKGMVAQRALNYEELDTEYLLLLDDDVELADDTAERLVKAAFEHNADAVGADVFRNQDMSPWQKAYAMLTNWVRPHCDENWAYKVNRTGDFAYLNTSCLAEEGSMCKPSQKLDGPCTMWKKTSLLSLHWADELWMDRLSSFAYGDDLVESYKSFVNGGRLFLLYRSGVKYLNAKTASSEYHHTHRKFYIRSLMSAMIWYRTIYEIDKDKWIPSVLYFIKSIWLLIVNTIAGILYMDWRIPVYYVEGLYDAWRFTHSAAYREIPSFKL